MPPKRNNNRSKAGKSKAAATAAVDAMADSVLPSDILLCILSRLPVKSLLRFKSVCKPWRKLFSTPKFIEFHHAQFSNLLQNQNFMIYSVSKTGADRHVMSLFRIDSDEVNPTKLDHPYPQSFLHMDFVGSCNGLICMAFPPFAQWIELWNPALKLSKLLQLPKLKFGDKESVSLGFGYNEDYGDFKVVRIGCLDCRKKFRAGVEVYSTKSDSWKTIKTDLKFRILHTNCDAVVAGNPHWIVQVNENVSDKSHIVWFDVKKMALRMVPSLNSKLDWDGRLVPLMEWKGSLAAIRCREIGGFGFGGFHVVLFDKVKKIWNMKHSFGPIEMNAMKMYSPLQCSKNGKIIGNVDFDGKLFVFDPETYRVKEFEVENVHITYFEIHEYNESLVALDGMKAVEVNKEDDDDDDDDVDFLEVYNNYMQLYGGNSAMPF